MICEAHGEWECGAMSCQRRWRPLPGRVIVTREQQLTSNVLHIIATDERGAKLADRGRVIAVGDAPKGADVVPLGADVFYLGPEERLAIEWEGQKAYAVSYDEVLGVVEDDISGAS